MRSLPVKPQGSINEIQDYYQSESDVLGECVPKTRKPECRTQSLAALLDGFEHASQEAALR